MDNPNYKFGKVIGKGSFGEVFEGKCLKTGTSVALKVIPTFRADAQTLRQECEILRRLKHPNIIQLYDYYETQDQVVIVTERAKESLGDLLKRETLGSTQIQQIASNLVSALYYIHGRRVFHRDIKPQNVLIGREGLAKLCDFGFARKLSLDAYLLTSLKGTPLYMPPEVIDGKTYDYSADMWSLGCLVYELLVGRPPYCTDSLLELVRMVKNVEIKWPERISSDCISFIQGLLEKDPKKRLKWPYLFSHPYVRDGVIRVDEDDGNLLPFTKALSPSQELAKEQQREILEQEITIKNDRKQKAFFRKLHKQMRGLEIGRTPTPFARNQPQLPGGHPIFHPLLHQQHYIPAPGYAPPVFPPSNQNQRPHRPQQPKILIGRAPKPGTEDGVEGQLENEYRGAEAVAGDPGSCSDDSSCETMTSSSSGDSDVECEGGVSQDEEEEEGDGRTIILDNGKILSQEDMDLMQKSAPLLSLYSFGSQDKPIESDEWVEFLTSTQKEVDENPKTLCEKHILTMIVAPLRNHLASTIVVNKIAQLLAMPFVHREQGEDLISNLESLYLDTKVVPNLLYACKLIVRRRILELANPSGSRSVDLIGIADSLTEEDLDGMDKCLRLISWLIHSESKFVEQLCDSVCVLQATLILQIFLKMDKRKTRITIQTLAVLTQLLRTIPSNVSIVEDVFIDGFEEHEELWRILEHSNPLVLSKSLRLMVYLLANSFRIKEILLKNDSMHLKNILQRAIAHEDVQVKTAAVLATQCLEKIETF